MKPWRQRTRPRNNAFKKKGKETHSRPRNQQRKQASLNIYIYFLFTYFYKFPQQIPMSHLQQGFTRLGPLDLFQGFPVECCVAYRLTQNTFLSRVSLSIHSHFSNIVERSTIGQHRFCWYESWPAVWGELLCPACWRWHSSHRSLAADQHLYRAFHKTCQKGYPTWNVKKPLSWNKKYHNVISVIKQIKWWNICNVLRW